MSWINNDGLEVFFGTEQARENPIGEYRFDGPRHVVEIEVDYTRLPAVASNSVVIDDHYTLPQGALVEAVEIITDTAFDSAGDAMTLNVGVIETDRTSNADVDYFVVAATQTELITGGTNVAGWVGTPVNSATPTAAPYLLTWEVDTAAATAGHGVIRIYYSVPA